MTDEASTIDPRLEEWASERQKEYIAAVRQHGGFKAAARALGVSHDRVRVSLRSLEARAALAGYAPKADMTKPVPQPFSVKGVSSFYGPDGELRGQWVKTCRDAEATERVVRDFVRHLAEDVRGLAPLTPAPERCNDDLLAVYLFGDPHFGLKANAAETGEDFDLAEADRLTRRGIDRLVDVTPAAKTALLINAGDNTHADNSKNVTPGHGHALDVDGRHFNTVQVSARAWVYATQRALEKHERVEVWFVPGNHDPETAFAIALCLSMFFEGEPRVKVDLSPSLYRYLRFGKVLIGATHGHGAKPQDMPLLMAVDRSQDWGETTYRYVYVGHIHHDSVKEIQGVRVESLRTLAAKDAWHTGKGYRSLRDTRSVVHHREYGEVERHTCSVAMLAPEVTPPAPTNRLGLRAA